MTVHLVVMWKLLNNYFYQNFFDHHKNQVPKLTYDSSCTSNYECQDFAGLSCSNFGKCRCSSTQYWVNNKCRKSILNKWNYFDASDILEYK